MDFLDTIVCNYSSFILCQEIYKSVKAICEWHSVFNFFSSVFEWNNFPKGYNDTM